MRAGFRRARGKGRTFHSSRVPISWPDNRKEPSLRSLMGTKGIFLSAVVAIAIGLGGNFAGAQSYPDRLIKIVVPYPPGGPADVAARLVTQPMSSRLGQNVIVENQPGAGGRTGTKAVAQASPDGYTLLLGGTNPNAIIQSLFRNLGFEP